MKENTSNEIVSLLKEYGKALLKDSIKIALFFAVFSAIVNLVVDNTFLEEGFFLELTLYMIWAVAILRGIFLALAILMIFLQKKDDDKKIQKEQFDSINADYAEDLNHYDDVFDLGSPMITKYINNPTTNSMDENVLVAGLVDLIRKKKVRVDGSFLVVIDNNVSLECEKFLLSKIKDGRFDMGVASSFYSDLGIYVAKDAVDKLNLLEKVKPKHKGHGKLIIVAIIFLILCAAFAGEDSYWYDFCELAAIVLSFYGIYYAVSLSNLKPTKKGEILNRKIEGLKRYLLKNYEVLAQENDEELTNQYLLHLTAWGHNPKMVEMYMKFVDITPEPEE